MKVQSLVIRFLLLVICSSLLAACGGGETAQAGPNESLIGQEVVLSDTIQSDILPMAVTHYGTGQYATLSALAISKTRSTVTGTVQVVRHGDPQDFSLVAHVVTADRWLGIHFQPDQRLIVVEPAPSQGNVLFSTAGYMLDEQDGKGTITFDFPVETAGMFDLDGNTGTVFVYLVTPPEDGSASLRTVVSNVISEKVAL